MFPIYPDRAAVVTDGNSAVTPLTQDYDRSELTIIDHVSFGLYY